MGVVKVNRRDVWMGLIGLIGLMFAALPVVRAQTDATNASPAAPTEDASATTNESTANPPPFVADTPPAASTPATSQATLPTGSPTDGQQDDISDIRPPFFFLHSWFWVWIALAAAAVAALLVLVWKWLSRSPYLSPKSAYELTLEKLEKARALLREDDPMPYAVFVSETIRSYLGQRFQTPSTRRTTEEFLRMMESDSGTPLAEHSDLLKNFLQACDLVKFARYQPTLSELEQVQQRAFTFVHATKPAPVAAHANGRRP